MKRIYLDHNATTPVSAEVFDAMAPFFKENFGNASSIHSFGRDAKVAMENSREACAALIGAEPSEITFTAGGTEADNLALKGAAQALKHKRNRIVTTPIEHSAIRQSADTLRAQGFDVQIAPVDSNGFVHKDEFAKLVDENTSIVSIMHANNEIGVVQDISSLVEIAHAKGALFHTDAVQSFGKIPVNVDKLGVDLLTLSAHKIYGPKGTGLVYCKSGVKLQAQVHGGSHEKGRRAGTENVAGIVGMAAAMQYVSKDLDSEYPRMFELSQHFVATLRERIENITLNGPELQEGVINRTPSTVNCSFAGAEGEAIILSLDLEGIAVSSGSACSSGAVDPSPILLAIGQSPELAKSSIRFSLGRSTKREDIDRVCDVLPTIIQRLRSMSPAFANAH